jgi:DegV family protein with EDD domain
MTASRETEGRWREAMAAGVAAVAAWAEVLDRINVFPVADGDTGRNLVVTLAPLRDPSTHAAVVLERLLLAARGNSGNIACAFVRALIEPDDPRDTPTVLGSRLLRGAARAREAVAKPQPGTMLTVLDALAERASAGLERDDVEAVLTHLTTVVRETTTAQEALRRSNVVDSGALGILVFLDELLRCYFGVDRSGPDLAQVFETLARFDRLASSGPSESGFCVDVVLRLEPGHRPSEAELTGVGDEVVALREGDLWKVHLHAQDVERAHRTLAGLGEVVRWAWDDLHEQTTVAPKVANAGDVHLVTDGAASLSRRDAEQLGISLLDSHIDFGDRSLPETRVAPEDLYRTMRRGTRVSTAQASLSERHLHYQRLATQWSQVLYLCVGSVYTGNYAAASAWSTAHAVADRFTVLDTGTASGKLAVVVRASARVASTGKTLPEVLAFATDALARAEEYIFPERLEYLARGGRLSKTGAWFGDALHLGPVVSPMPDGARKVAMLRKLDDKLAFACARVAQGFEATRGRGELLVQYTDNQAWVETVLIPRLHGVVPHATIGLGPLSLTTGAHTGPGTWAVALLPSRS